MSKKFDFKIENIVASAQLNMELDLFTLADEIDQIEYEPEQFPGAILKFKEPKASLLLFKNGKVICTGSKSEKEVQKALNKTKKLLLPYAKNIKSKSKPNFKIENIVSSASFDLVLDLFYIAYELDDIEYEPEQFPGAILKFKEPKASLLLFKNGKVICTGSKSEKEIEQALKKAYNLLKPVAGKQM